jgi:hypothetical protein
MKTPKLFLALLLILLFFTIVVSGTIIKSSFFPATESQTNSTDNELVRPVVIEPSDEEVNPDARLDAGTNAPATTTTGN